MTEASVPAASDGLRGRRRIAVVIGSTRPTRICPGIAHWVLRATQADSRLNYELLDLAEVNLPFLDEPLKAALQQYQHDHTRAWSRTVAAYDGFIFVFPQYNWGYPGVLKNALDFLYYEWHGKPVSYVTYGSRGGTKGAEQLRGVLTGLHMRILEHHLEVAITDDDVDDDWQLRNVDAVMDPHRGETKAIDIAMLEAIETPR